MRRRSVYAVIVLVVVLVVLVVVLAVIPFPTSRTYGINCHYPNVTQPVQDFYYGENLPAGAIAINWSANVAITMYVYTSASALGTSLPIYSNTGTAKNGSGSFSSPGGTLYLYCDTSSLGFTATPAASVTLDFSAPIL